MKFSWKYILLLPIFGLLFVLPIALTSCDDPATFFQKYGQGQNSNGNNSSNTDNEEDDGGSSGPVIPSSPY